MNHVVLHPVVQSVVLLLCMSGLCGCSLVGLGMGAFIDGGTPDSDRLRIAATMDLKPGDEIRIVLTDSTFVEGAYMESALLDSATYSSHYARFLAGMTAGTVPLPGDTLFIHTTTGRLPFRYVFRGFGIESMKFLRLDKSQITNVTLSYPTKLERHDGAMFDPAVLVRMGNEHLLPTDVLLVVRTTAGITRVPVDDIVQIDRPNSRTSKWIGLGIGAAADIIGIASISDGFKEIRLFGK